MPVWGTGYWTFTESSSGKSFTFGPADFDASMDFYYKNANELDGPENELDKCVVCGYNLKSEGFDAVRCGSCVCSSSSESHFDITKSTQTLNLWTMWDGRPNAKAEYVLTWSATQPS